MKRGVYEQMARDAEKSGTASEVTVRFVKLDEKNASVIGQLKGLAKVKSSKNPGEYFQYVIDTDNGLVKTSFGAAYDKEMHAVLRIGGVYKWTFLQQRDLNNGHRVNDFQTVLLSEQEAEESLTDYVSRNFPTVV